MSALFDLAGDAGHPVIHQGFAEFAVAIDRDRVVAAWDLAGP